MNMKSKMALALASTLVLAGCDTAANNERNGPNANANVGAAIGGMLGGFVGLKSDDNKLLKGVVGAGIGAAIGGAIGQSLERQAADLEKSLDNDDVSIVNEGDRLVVTLPQDILFDVDSDFVSSSLRGDLYKVANNLNSYPNSTIQIIGHTDNSGSAAHNQDLSARRAGSVSGILIDGGVAAGRVVSFGRGEDQPVATNLTAEGRAENRRVEIIILPTG